jgi:hypothetical protein
MLNESSRKLLCDEELEDKENQNVNSDITNKYKRKVNLNEGTKQSRNI